MILISILLSGCTTIHTYKGYVIDFRTGEGISEAQINLRHLEGTIMSDQEGYFKFSREGASCNIILYVQNITAEGYGILEDWTLRSGKEVDIFLMPSQSVYGTFEYEENKVEVQLREEDYFTTGEGFNQTVKPGENGDFYFENVPEGKNYYLHIYREGNSDDILGYQEISAEELKDDYVVYHDFGTLGVDRVGR